MKCFLPWTCILMHIEFHLNQNNFNYYHLKRCHIKGLNFQNFYTEFKEEEKNKRKQNVSVFFFCHSRSKSLLLVLRNKNKVSNVGHAFLSVVDMNLWLDIFFFVFVSNSKILSSIFHGYCSQKKNTFLSHSI